MDLLLTVSPFAAIVTTVIGTILAVANWYVWGETFDRFQLNPKPLDRTASARSADARPLERVARWAAVRTEKREALKNVA